LDLFRFIDWIMTLSPELEADFQTEITAYEEAHRMQYVTAIERTGIEKGIELGLAQGIEQGMMQGMMQGVERGIEQSTREDIVEVLALRFQEVPADMLVRLDEITDVARLKELLKWAVVEPSLEVFAMRL
jgi:flagellar biosynthesis/type III secretory pathway protein FliH